MAFRSGLKRGEEKEYEPTRIAYEIQYNYTPDCLRRIKVWEPDDRRKMKPS